MALNRRKTLPILWTFGLRVIMKNLKLATVNFTLPKTKYLLLQTIILYLVSVVFSPLFFSGCTAENEQKISKDISAENRTELLQKAVELTKEKNFGQAEIIFQRIINQKSDYQLFYFWAKLKIAENDLQPQLQNSAKLLCWRANRKSGWNSWNLKWKR